MLQRHHYIIVYLLLFCYVSLGIAGHLEMLILYGFGTDPQQITKSSNSPTSTCKVYWTQYKHIPSTIKISVPSPAVLTPPELPHRCEYAIAFTQGTFRIPSDPLYSLHSSRAPPQF
jgi:hypothetical protein